MSPGLRARRARFPTCGVIRVAGYSVVWDCDPTPHISLLHHSPVFPNRQHLLYVGLQMLFRNFCLADNPDKCSHTILLSLLHKNMASLYYKTMLTKIACFQEKASDFIIWECSIFPDFFEYGGALVCR